MDNFEEVAGEQFEANAPECLKDSQLSPEVLALVRGAWISGFGQGAIQILALLRSHEH